jgi:predicted nucleic acid-binding Zn ribbon protein
VIQKFSDTPIEEHKDCGGKVVRLISAPGLHFKGSGWYITDYARGGAPDKGGDKESGKSDSAPAETKSSEAKSDSKGDSKSESKSESKTASKPESKPAGTATKSD